jgi:hypothetical protein
MDPDCTTQIPQFGRHEYDVSYLSEHWPREDCLTGDSNEKLSGKAASDAEIIRKYQQFTRQAVRLPFPPIKRQQRKLLHNGSWVKPIIVAARPKAWAIFARSNAGIVVSNLTRGMVVCVREFCVCVVLCVCRGLPTGWSLVQWVLQTVYTR